MNTLQEKISNDLEKGFLSENALMKLMINEGYVCYKANEYQDRFEHWDFAIKENDKFIRIDVKSNKKSNSDGYTWIEFKNVLGHNGWIVSEFMDTIAFEKEDCFELINRSELYTFIVEKIKNADLEDACGDIIYCSVDNLKYYRKYSRVGRNDLVVKAPLDDFKHLIYKTIYKK